MRERGPKPIEQEKKLHPTFAFIGDTHLGSTIHEGITIEAFTKQCERVWQNEDINIVVLSGDILDRYAGEEAIAAVEVQLKHFRESGKQVVYVWGNNEDRLQEKRGDIRQRFQDCGAHVLQDEEEATIVDIPGQGEIAFVVASRIVSPEEQRAVLSQKDDNGNPDYLAQVLVNRRILEESGRLEKFKACLESTVRMHRAYDDEGRLIRLKREAIPTIILHHAPEELSLYPQEYSQHKDNSRIHDSAEFTKAMREHQERWGNIMLGAFGHVEGGKEKHIVEVPGGRDITFINTCSVVTGGNFVVDEAENKMA